jgi:hypothetical protein
MSIGAAAREARIAVNYSMSRENIDWAIPVVYAQDPENRLCEAKLVTRDLLMTPLVSTARRESAKKHTCQIAVWDITGTFPNLDETLQRLNRAQTRFGFILVDISAPAGTWTLKKGRTFYINDDRLVELFKNKTQELGVDMLFCITAHPLLSEDHTWWSDKGNIIIFSTHFLDVPKDRVAAERVIANVLVPGLAGLLSGLDSHNRPPKSCPMWADDQEDSHVSLAYLHSHQQFDSNCRKKLSKLIPQDLPALQRMLDTFF